MEYAALKLVGSCSKFHGRGSWGRGGTAYLKGDRGGAREE